MASIEVRTHTALHILKGAASKVLGVKWTAGTFVDGSHGRLAIQLNRKPLDEEISRIETETNLKIKEDAEIEELQLDRVEAEKLWGNSIYDLFPIPAHITNLRILHIPNWNVNACKEIHTKTTGEIGPLRIVKTRYLPAKELLEISFDIFGEHSR